MQFPSTVPAVTPYGQAPTAFPTTPTPSLPAMQSFDPYANSALGAPPADVPYIAPTQPPLYAPAATPPPAYGVPYAAPPQPSGGLMQNIPSIQWNGGANNGYNYQNSDGTVARLQRFLQQISAEHTYLYGDQGANDLEINRTEIAATFGVPIFYNPDTPLLITPGFAFNWFEGPATPEADLPPRVYDAYLDGAWRPKFNDFLAADLGLRTGVWTDFDAISTDSIRVLGRGLGIISLSPRMDLIGGVYYLDRNRIALLPAGGVHWRPNTEWDAYLVFPNPKVRKRFVNIGSSQWWWYVAGEYGGGRWTIQRDPGGVAGDVEDDIDYNDIRVIGGLEWETATQARGHLEIGYVFDREILYDQTQAPAKFELDDTFMARVGFDF